MKDLEILEWRGGWFFSEIKKIGWRKKMRSLDQEVKLNVRITIRQN